MGRRDATPPVQDPVRLTQLPTRLAIFPLPGAILFPGLQLPLHIFEPRYRALVGEALARDRLPLEHGVDGGDRADLELARDELFLVDVDLGQDHALVGILGRDLFEHRRQRLARAAPFGPEVEDDETGHGRFDHVLAEPVDRLLFIEVEAHARQGSLPLSRVQDKRPMWGFGANCEAKSGTGCTAAFSPCGPADPLLIAPPPTGSPAVFRERQ